MSDVAFEVAHRDETIIVAITTTLTLRTAAAVRGELLKCLAECPTALIIDVSRLTADSDLPLTVFRAVQSQAQRWPGVPMLLCRPTPALARRLAGRALGRDLAVYPTVEQAIAALGRPSQLRHTIRTDLPATVDAAPYARDVVVQACQDWGLDRYGDDAEVIVSELTSNAVRHARAPLRLLVATRGDRLHLAVRDGSPGLPPPADLVGTSSATPAEHGRGLYLIGAFATSWGSLLTADGKVVWATMRVQPATSVTV